MLLLGGALLLVALYLPWQRFSVDVSELDGGESLSSLLPLDVLEGWDSGVAPAAAFAALLLVGLSAVALVRPQLTTRLPLGRVAVATAYFGVAVAADTRSRGRLSFGGAGDLQLAYGAYVALGAAVATLIAALALRRAELPQVRSPFTAAAVIAASGLLLAFLLPWERFMDFDYTGIAAPAAQVAAVAAICTPAAPRGLALLVALFTAAAFSVPTFPVERAYGAWIGLGLAITFTVLSLSGGIRRPALDRIPWTLLVLGVGALLLVADFFLPWQEFCYPPETFGTTSERCVSSNGWVSESGTGAAVLAIALVAGALGRSWRLPPRAELAAGIALLVATLGFQVGHGGQYGLAYGFWIGAACTAVIVVLAFAGLGLPALDARLAPIALCLVYLAISVPTWWGVLDFDAQRFFWFAPFSWITIAGSLLALTLIRLWLGRGPDLRPLFLVPVVIAALATLDLVRAETMTWGGGIVLGLCVLLVLLAWVEHARGLGPLQVPELLRIDRL